MIQSQSDAGARSFNKSQYNKVINPPVSGCSTFLIFKTVTTLQAIALTCPPLQLASTCCEEIEASRRNLWHSPFPNYPPSPSPHHHPYLIPSGLSPPRWVACSNSSNSESDINASAISHPKGQFDLQNMSDARLEESVNQACVSVFITEHYSMRV